MIFPAKHIPLEASLFVFGAYLLKRIMKAPIYMDDLWEAFRKDFRSDMYHINFSFEQFIQTLDYLFMIGAVRLDERGFLIHETHQPDCQ